MCNMFARIAPLCRRGIVTAENVPHRDGERNVRLKDRHPSQNASPLHNSRMSRIVGADDGTGGCSRIMIKFMILFGPPEDAENFENVYQDFLALIERMPKILRRQVVHVTGSPQGTPEIHRILEIYFESTDAQTEALMSAAGQEAGKELQRLPDDAYQLLLTDVYEEEGGSTPQPARRGRRARDR